MEPQRPQLPIAAGPNAGTTASGKAGATTIQEFFPGLKRSKHAPLPHVEDDAGNRDDKLQPPCLPPVILLDQPAMLRPSTIICATRVARGSLPYNITPACHTAPCLVLPGPRGCTSCHAPTYIQRHAHSLFRRQAPA